MKGVTLEETKTMHDKINKLVDSCVKIYETITDAQYKIANSSSVNYKSEFDNIAKEFDIKITNSDVMLRHIIEQFIEKEREQNKQLVNRIKDLEEKYDALFSIITSGDHVSSVKSTPTLVPNVVDQQ